MNVSAMNAANVASSTLRAAQAPRHESEESMVRFGQSMAQVAKQNFQAAQADRVTFSHNPNGKVMTAAEAATTGGAVVGSAAAAAGSVWAFTHLPAAIGGVADALVPALGVGLAATSALLGLFAVSGFFGGKKA